MQVQDPVERRDQGGPLLRSIRRLFVGSFYIRIKKGWLSARFAERGQAVEDETCVALESQGNAIRIAAIGREARALASRPNHSLRDGFSHPRTPISDFTIAERTLQH